MGQDEDGRGDAREAWRRGGDGATFRELSEAVQRLLDRMGTMEGRLTGQMRDIERETHKKLGEVERRSSDELEVLRQAVSDLQNRTRWITNLSRAVLAVFGTAIGGALLYLLRLPSGGSP